MVLCSVLANSQEREFEVASVRPSPQPSAPRIKVTFDGGPDTSDPTRFSCRNCSLARLVMHAYNVEYYQVVGLNSRSEDLYDIAATIHARATKDQFRSMLQNLLSDRFKNGCPPLNEANARVRIGPWERTERR